MVLSCSMCYQLQAAMKTLCTHSNVRWVDMYELKRSAHAESWNAWVVERLKMTSMVWISDWLPCNRRLCHTFIQRRLPSLVLIVGGVFSILTMLVQHRKKCIDCPLGSTLRCMPGAEATGKLVDVSQWLPTGYHCCHRCTRSMPPDY